MNLHLIFCFGEVFFPEILFSNRKSLETFLMTAHLDRDKKSKILHLMGSIMFEWCLGTINICRCLEVLKSFIYQRERSKAELWKLSATFQIDV